MKAKRAELTVADRDAILLVVNLARACQGRPLSPGVRAAVDGAVQKVSLVLLEQRV